MLSYLRDVLGIQTVLLPEGEALASSRPLQPQTQIWIQASAKTKEELELLERILKALKYPKEWIQMGKPTGADLSSQVYLEFSGTQTGHWSGDSGSPTLRTAGIPEMLRDPRLKKLVWEDLKLLMEKVPCELT